ncbi:MAG: type IIA DNA topoisomerase subunit B [Paludibacter sp.]|nr:type IIA DNA topoisomerase subunit B [Paludibacter sp.]
MNEEIIINANEQGVAYNEDNIQTLEGLEHIRHRPTMYIGKTGDGSQAEDGIYVLMKETLDNSIDEFRQGNGNQILITLADKTLSIRDYGRGIPQGKLIEAVSIPNTSGKFDSKAFQKSIGLNGVGLKAVNATSEHFTAVSYRDGQARRVAFEKGVLISDETTPSNETGTLIEFKPDTEIFHNFHFREEYIETMLRNYSYLNTRLALVFNGQKFVSKNGLLDLLNERITAETLYPIVHFKSEDIEIAFTHTTQNGEECYSFVNGQYTTQGGTHQTAFRESMARTIKEFYNKGFEYSDIRSGLVAAVYVAVQEPEFESQTKIKLGSKNMGPDGPTVAKFINDFVSKEVDNLLHREKETADAMLQKIQESEKERKAIAGVTKQARERAKKVNLHNEKLRDCRAHYNDTPVKDENKNLQMEQSSIFITEGNSASGSITKSRDVITQAVFSLRGKPLNSYGQTKKIVYQNEEFNLLQAALNIEDGIEGLRYNKIIIATDADDDGMHIRLLLLTFFLQFFPELVKKGHVFILQTPLFRVRNKKETIYCYSDNERINAMKKLGANPEITRFKGLGEISPDEFKGFIGENIRLDQVRLSKEDDVANMLDFYMGKNTPDRQEFIVRNLVVEEDAA